MPARPATERPDRTPELVTSPDRSEPTQLGQIDDQVGPLMRQAGEIALRHFRTATVIEDKGGRGGFDPVTEADRMVERYLREEIAVRFPDAQITGEEDGTTGPAGRMHWVIDPIDGTKAYVTGVPLWGVLLGLLVDDRPVAGWCRQPYLDETFAAVGGRGWLEHAGKRRNLHTAPTTELAHASMYSTHPSMFATPWERAAFATLAARVRLQRFGGDCYSYCLLAAGSVDLVVEADLHPYDILPLIPIVEAAGGLVTGSAGEVPVEGGFVVAAATEQLHTQVLACLQETRAS